MTQERSRQKSRSITYYKLLGVKPTASESDIRQAYRQKSKLYHPDTTSLPPAIAAEKFEQLKEAYTALSDSASRGQYDRSQVVRRSPPAKITVSTANLDPKQRPLSAGEVFALFLLGITFAACLALALVVGTAHSEEWKTSPPQWAQPVLSWLKQHPITAQPPVSAEKIIVKGVSFSSPEQLSGPSTRTPL